MNRADSIRQFVLSNYIQPARVRGDTEVTVRAGDVHKAMNLKDAMPAVASALGANKFQEFAKVKLIKREGPQNGANLLLAYKL
ncbi:hypothetical protein TFLX_00642 [Thermoflexales bacterium]|nr:hypothetical protein TFLX_00642 [Thermoflexales bacterium]